MAVAVQSWRMKCDCGACQWRFELSVFFTVFFASGVSAIGPSPSELSQRLGRGLTTGAMAADGHGVSHG